MKSLALVESPAQLLNVVEWADQVLGGSIDLTVVVLAPRNELSRRQLRATAVLAREAGLKVQWHEPRQGGASTARTVRALAVDLNGVQRLVVGDPFSGVMQVVISVARAREVVMVDDGTATMEFARQWLSGEHLSRWHQVVSPAQRRGISTFARDQIADSVRRRLSVESGTRLSLFSCLPIDIGTVPVVRNTFAWTRRRFGRPVLKDTADLVGTSLVETGVVDAGHYVAGVGKLAARFAVDRYFAHRQETDEKLAQIAELGLEVVRPDLPLEVVARRGPVGRRVLSFPSTVVHTLPLVLADTEAELLVCDVADDWYTPDAPIRSVDFLGEVTRAARSRFGLGAVAS